MTAIQRELTKTVITSSTLASYKPKRHWQRNLLWGFMVIALIIMDLFMMGSGFAFAWVFHPSLEFESLVFLPIFSLFLPPLWFLIFGITGLYNERNILRGYREYGMVFRATTVGLLSVVVAGFVQESDNIDAIWLVMAWIITTFLVWVGRTVMRLVMMAMRRQGVFLATTLIVGANDESVIIASQLKQAYRSGLNVIGFVDNNKPINSTWASFPILGAIDQLELLIVSHNVEEVILITSAFSREELLSLFRRYGISKHINLRLSSGLFEIITTGLEVKELAGVPLTRINRSRLTGVDRYMKMAMDYMITFPGVIAITPLLLLIAFLIKIDSPGPIIHRRRVVGTNGRTFDAYKFRTMHINGDEILAKHPQLEAELAQNHKLKEDPRITRMGRILRKTSFDELPQLINVLKQQMSLVGPRMIAPDEISKYNRWDINLLTVRPGITGLWQVSGRSDISYEERVQYDMLYIRDWTIWLDLKILARTIPVIFTGHGAY